MSSEDSCSDPRPPPRGRGRDSKVSSWDREDVCLDGEWSFTSRPLLHVSHTWVLERRALMGCEWTLLTSRRFGSRQDDDVTWTVSLEVDTGLVRSSSSSEPAVLRPTDTVKPLPALVLQARVCVAFGTGVAHKRVFFKAALRAQEEAVRVDESAAAQAVLDAAGEYAFGDRALVGMTRLDPHRRECIGTLYLVESDLAPVTVRVDIAYFADVEEARPGPAGVSLRVPPCSLSADMEALLADGQLADAVLAADGREWRVHKAILAARSSVFAAMFKHDMAESKSSRVTVGDVSADVLDQVLRYMYTGKVDHIRVLGADLLAVADRYALPRLKALCEEELARSVSDDNALDVLLTADLHSARELRLAALQCISSNIHKVLGTAAWRELVSLRPHLLEQVLATCVNHPIPE
ncbi:Speckle-type POZ protein B [Frankliniella fusca]|uniref:Speckle-type POZ protein B n=1 Tax=Frankliniella fusca TaxID=407009 RepID=A0AAE1L781_9NEOP|nr:Speckle-type POZ protein B [Frankliniella fusca]